MGKKTKKKSKSLWKKLMTWVTVCWFIARFAVEDTWESLRRKLRRK